LHKGTGIRVTHCTGRTARCGRAEGTSKEGRPRARHTHLQLPPKRLEDGIIHGTAGRNIYRVFLHKRETRGPLNCI